MGARHQSRFRPGGRCAEPQRPEPQAHFQWHRCQPHAPGHRLRRPLLPAPRRPQHAAGSDGVGHRRPDSPGQNPQLGVVELPWLAHRRGHSRGRQTGCRPPCHQPAAVQHRQSSGRSRTDHRRAELRLGRCALQPAGAWRAQRQICAGCKTGCQQPCRARRQTYSGNRMARRIPAHRPADPAIHARSWYRYHRVRDCLGAEQQRRHLGHCRAAHRRAMGCLH